MIVPTCARCNRPFPANNELASLPHGKRVAFDPELGRVWRICTKCGEWNLVGPQRGPTTVAELHSRLAAPPSGTVVHDAIGDIDVIRVTEDPHGAVVTDHGLKAKRQFQSWGWFAKLIPALTVIWIAWNSKNLVLELISARSLRQTALVVGVLTIWLFGTEVVHWLLNRRVRVFRAMVAVAGSCVAVAIVLASPHPEMFLIGLPMILLLPASSGIMEYFGLSRKVVLADGSTLRVSANNAKGARIGWDIESRQLVADHLPRNSMVFGPQVLRVIEAMSVGADLGNKAVVEGGWSILRQNRDIEGVLRRIGELRPEEQSRHQLNELPPAFRAAIILGVIEASGTDAERDAIREQIAAASEVAAIAESLDATPDASRLKPRLGEPKH